MACAAGCSKRSVSSQRRCPQRPVPPVVGDAAPQQQLREAVARPRAVGHGVLARAAEVAHRLLVDGRGMHRREQVRAQQRGELPCVAAVGLDAVAGPPRDQRRRDHPAFDACGLELALQREAPRPRLVAGHDRPRRHAPQALREPLHRLRLVRQLPLLGPSALRRQHRHVDRPRVCIHPCICGSHLPDRLPFVCGSAALASVTREFADSEPVTPYGLGEPLLPRQPPESGAHRKHHYNANCLFESTSHGVAEGHPYPSRQAARSQRERGAQRAGAGVWRARDAGSRVIVWSRNGVGDSPVGCAQNCRLTHSVK